MISLGECSNPLELGRHPIGFLNRLFTTRWERRDDFQELQSTRLTADGSFLKIRAGSGASG